jgi:hypothetical protein
MAEDARIITVKKIDEERLASERQAGADREALRRKRTCRGTSRRRACYPGRGRRRLPRSLKRTA